jgi:hypothetical protein
MNVPQHEWPYLLKAANQTLSVADLVQDRSSRTMKFSRLALSAMIASACISGTAFGQTNRTAPRYAPATYYSYYDEGKAAAPATSPSDGAAAPVAPATATAGCDKGACDLGNGCDGNGCDSLCGGGGGLLGGGLLGGGLFDHNRCLDNPWKLFPCPVGGFTIGGWSQVGYHAYANNLIPTDGSRLGFNTYPRNLQLQQQWLYAERKADGSNGIDIGGRIDYLYGTDAPDTQAFGKPGHWDTNWDNGAHYGHALPQLYGEVAVGDFSVKLGKFFTIIGNEVVAATGNFFYSRQFTFYNAEPFTHTGALTTYKLDDSTEIYNGWVTGWDSGFENNGDAYLGGFKRTLSDDWSFVYTTCQGRFGESASAIPRERGQIHSGILTGKLTDKLTYISQTDVLYTKYENQITARNTFGNINYLIYQINDRWAFGQRFEWFNIGGDNNVGQAFVQNQDVYNYTMGFNYRATSNLLFRPECRWVWDKEDVGFNEPKHASSQAALGGDMIFTF